MTQQPTPEQLILSIKGYDCPPGRRDKCHEYDNCDECWIYYIAWEYELNTKVHREDSDQ